MLDHQTFSVFQETKNWLAAQKIDCMAFEKVDSTNKMAKDEACTVSDSLRVYLANHQTAGRGRSHNSWLNPKPHTSLMATWSISLPDFPQPISAPLCGLALHRCVKGVWPKLQLRLKPPNDLLINDLKFCGLLLEVVKCTNNYRLLIGIGLNVFSHPLEITTATHLGMHTRELSLTDWQKFIATLAFELNQLTVVCTKPHLEPADISTLLIAMNEGLPEDRHYSSISKTGDLKQGERTISWRDL